MKTHVATVSASINVPAATPGQSHWISVLFLPTVFAAASGDVVIYRPKLPRHPPPSLKQVNPAVVLRFPEFLSTAVCYRVFFTFVPHELRVFLCFVLLCAVVATFLFGRALIRRGLNRWATILLMSFALTTSYPLWFELKQANMEICSWVLLALGLWAFMRGRGYAASACFGIAGALKITPFLYLGLFLAKRQYRHILFAFLSAAAVTVSSLWLVYPHIGDSWRLTNLAVSRVRSSISPGPMDPYKSGDPT